MSLNTFKRPMFRSECRAPFVRCNWIFIYYACLSYLIVWSKLLTTRPTPTPTPFSEIFFKCTHLTDICLLWFLEEKLIISLQNFKQVGCVIETEFFLWSRNSFLKVSFEGHSCCRSLKVHFNGASSHIMPHRVLWWLMIIRVEDILREAVVTSSDIQGEHKVFPWLQTFID
jgi:hypothetical protein